MPTCGSPDGSRRPDMSFAYVDEYLAKSPKELRALPPDTLDFIRQNLSPELRTILEEKLSKKES